MTDEILPQVGFEVQGMSDDELRRLRKAATDELRRRGVLPAKEGKSERARGGKKGRQSAAEGQ